MECKKMALCSTHYTTGFSSFPCLLDTYQTKPKTIISWDTKGCSLVDRSQSFGGT